MNLSELKPLKEIRELYIVQKRYVLRAYKTLSYNKTQTARALGVSQRTMRLWFRKWEKEEIENAIIQRPV